MDKHGLDIQYVIKTLGENRMCLKMFFFQKSHDQIGKMAPQTNAIYYLITV